MKGNPWAILPPFPNRIKILNKNSHTVMMQQLRPKIRVEYQHNAAYNFFHAFSRDAVIQRSKISDIQFVLIKFNQNGTIFQHSIQFRFFLKNGTAWWQNLSHPTFSKRKRFGFESSLHRSGLTFFLSGRGGGRKFR